MLHQNKQRASGWKHLYQSHFLEWCVNSNNWSRLSLLIKLWIKMAVLSQLSHCCDRRQSHLWLWPSTHQRNWLTALIRKKKHTKKEQKGVKRWFPLALEAMQPGSVIGNSCKGITCLHLGKGMEFTCVVWVKVLNAFYEEMTNISPFPSRHKVQRNSCLQKQNF